MKDKFPSPVPESLKQRVLQHSTTKMGGFHGPKHWSRVESNGLKLAALSGANSLVVSLFALFHDAARLNDDFDPEHGQRGAQLALSLRDQLPPLTESEFAMLVYACSNHTDGLHHPDPTIGTCWDADRLDLGRVGIEPDPNYFSTSAGRMECLRRNAVMRRRFYKP